MDGKSYFKYLDIDGKIILKLNFKKRMGGYGLDSPDLG
jgi:hypothetical protein